MCLASLDDVIPLWAARNGRLFLHHLGLAETDKSPPWVVGAGMRGRASEALVHRQASGGRRLFEPRLLFS